VHVSADTELEAEAARLAGDRRRARGLTIAARRALRLARRYRAEEGSGGTRERACVAQALTWRAMANKLRSRVGAELGRGPGLARASVPPASSDANRRSA
jgi:hypothetical protein